MIDIGFDFRNDAGGRDPDTHSPTLRRYHQHLWSRPLPGGAMFDLEPGRKGNYLHHSSELGEFWLSSDSVIPSYTRWDSMRPIISQIPEDENEAFRTVGYTIGGMMLFPSNQVERKPTINVMRGFLSRTIADRMDLTLEAIRLHYQGGASPLAATLARYTGFFALFDDFDSYVSFFLLDDLVEHGQVRFFLPFDGTWGTARPADLPSYCDYRRASIEFVQARNQRIRRLAIQAPGELPLADATAR